MSGKTATVMFGLLKKIKVNRRPQKQHDLRKQAERILQHDQMLLARVPAGRDDTGTVARSATLEPPPHKQLTYFGTGEAATPAALPANLDDELRRLSKLMDLDD